MFALLKISDRNYVVRKTRMLKNNRKNKCTISYKGRSVDAMTISYQNERTVLEDIAKNLRMSIPVIRIPLTSHVGLSPDNEHGHGELLLKVNTSTLKSHSSSNIPVALQQATQALKKDEIELTGEEGIMIIDEKENSEGVMIEQPRISVLPQKHDYKCTNIRKENSIFSPSNPVESSITDGKNSSGQVVNETGKSSALENYTIQNDRQVVSPSVSDAVESDIPSVIPQVSPVNDQSHSTMNNNERAAASNMQYNRNLNDIERHTVESIVTSVKNRKQTSEFVGSPTGVEICHSLQQSDPSGSLDFMEYDTTCNSECSIVVEEESITKAGVGSIESDDPVSLKEKPMNELSCNIANNPSETKSHTNDSDVVSTEAVIPKVKLQMQDQTRIEVQSISSSMDNGKIDVENPETQNSERNLEGNLDPSTRTQGEEHENNIQRGNNEDTENSHVKSSLLEDSQEMDEFDGKTSTPKLLSKDAVYTENLSDFTVGEDQAQRLTDEDFQMDPIPEINHLRAMDAIFETLDDPELNMSNEVMRDPDGSVGWNSTFDVDALDFINPKLLNQHSDPLLSTTDLDIEASFGTGTDINDRDFDISLERKDQQAHGVSDFSMMESEVEETEGTSGDRSSTDLHDDKGPLSFAGALDDSQLIAKPRKNKRQDFCFYCKKMQTVISRHLVTVHKEEEAVRRFKDLPKGNPERAQHIDTLRKAGNHIYNTNPDYNKDGQLLVARRPPEERPATQYASCHNCKGTFSKKSIRRHRQRCIGASIQGTRANTVLSRRVEGRLHENANENLQKVFSVLKEDAIIRPLRYDELIIEFGNGLCTKYVKDQQHAMIRNRLRTLGRLLDAMKKCRTRNEPEITDFASIYDPGLYDCMLRAVNMIAGFDPETGNHKIPSIVTALGIYIKAVADILILMVIKKKDGERRKLIEDYLFIHQKQYNMKINRIAYEAQAKKKRENKKPLPTIGDIQKLQKYVNTKRQRAYEDLERAFSYQSWLELAQTTLISIMIFNRRRAGESERIGIDDLKNCQKFNEETHVDEYKTLSEEQKEEANRYSLFIITGKLGNDVPVLLDADMEKCLSKILEYRDNAKVPRKNPYIFGVSGFADGRFKYLSACSLMRDYSEKCGAEFPERLRGTFLRKHLATMCAAQNMRENETRNVSNHMGHDIGIHRKHYTQMIVKRNVIGVGKALRSACGEESGQRAGHNRMNNGVNANKTEKQDGDSHFNDKSNTYETEEQNENSDKDDSELRSSHRVEVPGMNKVMKKRARIIIPETDSEWSEDEYQPNQNDCDSESEDSEEDPPLKRSKREVSRKRGSSKVVEVNSKKKKPRWSDEEKAVCFEVFGDKIQKNQLPSTSEIREFLQHHPRVNRSVNQIRTWASNIKQKKLKSSK